MPRLSTVSNSAAPSRDAQYNDISGHCARSGLDHEATNRRPDSPKERSPAFGGTSPRTNLWFDASHANVVTSFHGERSSVLSSKKSTIEDDTTDATGRPVQATNRVSAARVSAAAGGRTVTATVAEPEAAAAPATKSPRKTAAKAPAKAAGKTAAKKTAAAKPGEPATDVRQGRRRGHRRGRGHAGHSRRRGRRDRLGRRGRRVRGAAAGP